MADLDPTNMVPWAHQSLQPKRHQLFLQSSCQTARRTDRPTDRPRYSDCSNRPHLYVVLRCGLKRRYQSVLKSGPMSARLKERRWGERPGRLEESHQYIPADYPSVLVVAAGCDPQLCPRRRRRRRQAFVETPSLDARRLHLHSCRLRRGRLLEPACAARFAAMYILMRR